MRDPGKREAFQHDLRACHVPDGLHIDEHLEFVNNYLIKSARRLFPADNDIPRKPWISGDTWSIVKLIAPARKQIAIVVGRKREWVLKASFCVWRVLDTPTIYSYTPSPHLPSCHVASHGFAGVSAPATHGRLAVPPSPPLLPGHLPWARGGLCSCDPWARGCSLPSPRV